MLCFQNVILNAVKNLEATMEQRGKVSSRADPSTPLRYAQDDKVGAA